VVPAWQAEWDRTLAAARAEGALALVGPAVQTQREALTRFQAAYPDIRLEYTGLGATEYEARVRSERAGGIYLWDVFVDGITATVYTEHIPGGWYAPLRPALIQPEVLDDSKWLGGFDSGFLDTGKSYAYGFSLRVQYNTKVNRDFVSTQDLRSAEDLFKPQFREKIAILDPRGPSAGSNQMVAYRKAFGDEWVRRLMVDQEPVLTGDRRQITDWLVRGRYPIAIGVSDDFLTPFRDEGLGKNVVSLATGGEPAGTGNGGVVLLDRGPHPNATKIFLNWLLSADGQREWVTRTAFNSRRLDVPVGDPEAQPDPTRPDSYYNPGREENAAFYVETLEFLRRLRP
jgi:iron(III) transport system substrate-binding protein